MDSMDSLETPLFGVCAACQQSGSVHTTIFELALALRAFFFVVNKLQLLGLYETVISKAPYIH